MAMSDCVKCWDTPCTCGWALRHYSLESLQEDKERIERAIQFKKEYPEAVFSRHGEEETEYDEAFMLEIRNT